jgi:hypothetical protein
MFLVECRNAIAVRRRMHVVRFQCQMLTSRYPHTGITASLHSISSLLMLLAPRLPRHGIFLVQTNMHLRGE